MESGEHENDKRIQPHGRLRPAFWGAGCAWAAFLCAVRFTEFGGETVPPALLQGMAALIIGALAAAAAVAIAAARGWRAAADLPTAALPIGSTLAAVGSLGLFGWYSGAPFFLGDASGALCLLLGVGLMLVAVAWGALYARLEPEQLLPNGAAALVLASLLHAGHEALGFSAAAWAAVVVLIAASALCAHLARRNPTAIPGCSEETGGGVDAPSAVIGALRMLWMPLVGACIGSFIFGLTWDPIASSEHEMRVAQQVWGAMVAGPVIMALAVALVCSRSRGTSPLRLFDQTVYPVAVMLLLVIPVVNQAVPSFRFAGNILSSGSFAVVALCMWSNMAAAVRSVPISAARIFPAAFVLFGLCFAAGLSTIALLGTDGRTLCLVAFALYLALMAISFALGTREEKAALVTERPDASDTRSYIHRRCDDIARAFALSPRESEVLYYLGRGYNHTYIARKLYISENTVRTHVRHIYGKLGISSREELIDLVDGA